MSTKYPVLYDSRSGNPYVYHITYLPLVEKINQKSEKSSLLTLEELLFLLDKEVKLDTLYVILKEINKQLNSIVSSIDHLRNIR